MKRLLLTAVFCTVCFMVSAQERKETEYANVKTFEFEIGFGTTVAGENAFNSTSPPAGFNLFLEPRVNIKGTPFDVAAQFSIGAAGNWDYDNHVAIQYRPSLVVFADYNFRKWRRVSLFGGVGLGMTNVKYSYDGERGDDAFFDNSFVLNPRIGVEFWNHLRITLEYKWTKREYSFFGVTIGGVIGGGYRK